MNPKKSKRAKEREEQADYFLTRLRRLIDLESRHSDHLTKEGVQLLRAAIFSTLCDCMELGSGDLALGFLRERVHRLQLASGKDTAR